MRVLPLLSGSPLPLLPRGVRATALEFAALAGHTLLYPLGVTQERCALAPPVPPEEDGGAYGRPSARGPDRLPVLLLHGFADNRSVFALLRRSLARNGWCHILALNYSPLTRDVRRAAERLAQRVEDVCERTGRARIDVVGHSLGGLIARYYIQCLGGDARVRTLVTIGTPHAGTRVANLLPAHPIMRQLRPASPLMEELAGPAPGCRTRFVSFWSDLDQVMVPPETARLDHPDLETRDVRVRGLGHIALPAHGEVVAGVRRELGRGGRRAADGCHRAHGRHAGRG